MTARPQVPQEFSWAINTRRPEALTEFWQSATGLAPSVLDGFVDPDQRHPRIWFHPADPTPLRNRFHFDIARAEPVAERTIAELTRTGDGPSGPFGVRHADPEGNEVDLVPGSSLDGEGLEDWSLIFGAQVFYPTTDLGLAVELATRAATLADEHHLDVLIDVRPEGVFIDSGKDRWERPGFAGFAADVQAQARAMGLVADRSRTWFVQVGIDAVDVEAVRAFWLAALGYEKDERSGITDIVDPRGLNHPIFIQDLDPGTPSDVPSATASTWTCTCPRTRSRLAARRHWPRAVGPRRTAGTPSSTPRATRSTSAAPWPRRSDGLRVTGDPPAGGRPPAG